MLAYSAAAPAWLDCVEVWYAFPLAAGARVVSVVPQRQTLEEHFLREVQGVAQ